MQQVLPTPVLNLLERQNKFLLDKEEHIKKIREDM